MQPQSCVITVVPNMPNNALLLRCHCCDVTSLVHTGGTPVAPLCRCTTVSLIVFHGRQQSDGDKPAFVLCCVN